MALVLSDDDSENVSREASPCSESPQPISMGYESPLNNNVHSSVMASTSMSKCNATMVDHAKVCLSFVCVRLSFVNMDKVYPIPFCSTLMIGDRIIFPVIFFFRRIP